MFAKITLCLFLGVLVLCCLATTSAFGQSAYNYTDSWADTEQAIAEGGQEFGEVLVVGCGVLEVDESSGGHQANMEVKLTSPQGYTTFQSGVWTGETSSMTLVVSLNAVTGPITDLGTYLTETSIQMICPFEPTSYGTASLPISIKRDVYVLIGDIPIGGKYGYGYCEYDNYCPFGFGICGLEKFSVERYNANAVCSGTIQCWTLFVRGSCLNKYKVCTGIPPNTGTCDYN
jgi:hypothetical protein